MNNNEQKNNLIEHRMIFFSKEINTETVDLLKQQLMHYMLEGGKITVFLNSPGGVVQEAEALLDLIHMAKNSDIRIVGNGLVASAAAYLLTCIPGKRYLTKNSKYMIHEPLYSSLQYVNHSDLKKRYDTLDVLYERLIEQYLVHSKVDRETLQELLAGEGTTMSADDALKYGFIDAIIEDISELL